MKRDDMTLLSREDDGNVEKRCGFTADGTLYIADFYESEGAVRRDTSTGSCLDESEYTKLHRLLTKRIAFMQGARSGRVSINREDTMHLIRALYVDACDGDQEADRILNVVRGAIDLAVQATPSETD